MSLLRNAIRSSVSLRYANRPNQAFASLLLRESPRSFSTEAEQPPQAPVPQPESPQDSAAGSSFPQQSSGLVYGRLYGVSSTTLKTDVISLLDGCKLTPNDVRVDYNQSFSPVGMLIQFPSRRVYDQALGLLNRNGRLYRMERAERRIWDILKSYDGKTVCIKGIPQNALVDDLDRFLSGCEYNPSNIQMFSRNMSPGLIRLALVQFPSQAQAMNAFITKNRGIILNNQVSMQVLQ